MAVADMSRPGAGAATGTNVGAARTPALRLPPGFLVLVLLLMAVLAVVVALTTRFLVLRAAPGAAVAPGEMEYIDLGEIYATLPTDSTGQTSRYFRVQVAVGLGRENRVEVRDRIERLLPKIKSEIQALLLKESYPQVRLPESKKRLQMAILDALIGVLGPGTVQEVVLPKYEPQ